MLGRLRDSLLSLIYPQNCHVCNGQVERHNDGVACADCWAATRIFDGSEMVCARCGSFFGDVPAPVAVYCRRCDDHHYDRAFAIGIYEKALAASIVRLKTVPSLCTRFTNLIRNQCYLSSLNADVIMPIPLSPLRRIERGFNQAEAIGEIVAKTSGIAMDTYSLTRKAHTPIHRMGMDQKARELTVKNAFEIARPKLLAGQRVLLVDDVLTSGATASACAKTLKRCGAERVEVFTLARAVMN